MATIECRDCDGAGKLSCFDDTWTCAHCKGTGEIDIDAASDRDVIEDCRGVNAYRDDLILSQVIAKFGLDAFTDDALGDMAQRYRAKEKLSEKMAAANRARHAELEAAR